MNSLIGAFASKTIWVNVIAAVGAALLNGLTEAGVDPVVFAGVQSVVNIVVRFFTTGSLDAKVS